MTPVPNERGLYEDGPGYLYAIVTEHLGTAHVKLGSTAAADPVAMLHTRYGTPLGRPIVLWTTPSAQCVHDERTHMHAYFGAYRLWPDREIFDCRPLGSYTELRETLLFFEYTLRDEFPDDPDTRPPEIQDLQWGSTAVYPDRRVKRSREQWMAETDERRRSAEAERDAARSAADLRQHNLLGQLIEEQCDVGAGLFVVASQFNELARGKGCVNGVKADMLKRGFALKTVRIDSATPKAYVGLQLKA